MARLLVFGDSIAHGAKDSNGGWVAYLRKHFDEAGENNSLCYSVYNQAISGNNTNDLINRFDCEMKYRMDDPDGIIVFAIGINDAAYWKSLDDKPLMSVEKFKDNLLKLIENSRKYSEKIIFIGITPVVESRTSPIPWNTDITYTNERIKEFERAISETAKENSLPYIALFENYSKEDCSALLPDGVHPNTAGHKILFEFIKNL